jgi:TolB-like protein/class 3 adenylate cyclase/Tfp pilus assembly protein PilF
MRARPARASSYPLGPAISLRRSKLLPCKFAARIRWAAAALITEILLINRRVGRIIDWLGWDMATHSQSDLQFEIGHVLFIDIVGYSKLLIDEQREQIRELKEIVRGTEQFRLAEAEDKLLRLPTGDGGALVFRNTQEAPVLCALEISKALKNYPELRVRMGIHSGPVNEVADLNEQMNMAGAGINIARRVMDCGDAGHILLSKHVAEDLEDYARWRPYLHKLGECETKHGAVISVVNLHDDEVGNPQLPEKLKEAQQERTAKALAKSIAVLPFENLSRDQDNAYFAQGIQQEILTRLTSIADLRVISRTSTEQYQSKPGNLSKIAKQLRVANILEGSVQKVADQVRVNVQLINAQSDSHLWAETYDRKLTDIFGVESEIAKGIAESLQAKLTGREEQALVVKPTNNPEAYDAYLRALASEAHSGPAASRDAIRKAISLYESAVKLDPNFGLGWARLSRAHALLYSIGGGDTTDARRDAAKSALENAQKLQANSPETQLALGYYQYWVLHDYGPAKNTFIRVGKMLPGSSEVPRALGSVTTREGQWDESVAYLEQGLALDPLNAALLNQAAATYAALRQFPTALKLHDRALDIVPKDPDLMAWKASIYQAQGNLAQAARALSQVNTRTASWRAFRIKITQLRLERNHGEAIRLLQARQGPGIENVAKQVLLALAQRLAGDTVGAKVTAEQARDLLEAPRKNQPDDACLAGALSLTNAVLGEKHSALKGAERAVMLLPTLKDRVWGPGFEEILALIQTMLGENSRAISTLARLLQTPYVSLLYFQIPVTPALLRLDPLWDPLRVDPAFQKVCEEKQPECDGLRLVC